MKSNWLQLEVAQLRRMHGEGLTSGEIGRRLGRSPASVTSKLWHLGLLRRQTGTPAQSEPRKVVPEKAPKVTLPKLASLDD